VDEHGNFLHTSTDDSESSHTHWDEQSFIIEQNLFVILLI